jgi:hypothetical protein
MTGLIATAAEAESLIHRLQQGVWQLAAVAVVLSAANILQSAGMLSGAAAWASQDDDATCTNAPTHSSC